jgi:hypothetical protein
MTMDYFKVLYFQLPGGTEESHKNFDHSNRLPDRFVNSRFFVGFKVITAAIMKMAVFWIVAP